MRVPWPHHVARVAIALSATLATAGEGRAADSPPYVLSIIPNRPPVDIHRSWTPVVERLSRETGIRIRLRLYEGMSGFLDETASGGPDLLFASPNLYFLSHRQQGYVPLIRGALAVRGLLFVRKDSPYRSVRDLDGKTIAFVGPVNACAVLVRHALGSERRPIRFRSAYAGTPTNVAKTVLLGKADAGAALDGALSGDPRVDAEQLRIILETEPIAPHPLAAHPRVPAEVRERIVTALLALAATDDGRRMLAGVQLTNPVRADHARDYGALDSLDLDPAPEGAR